MKKYSIWGNGKVSKQEWILHIYTYILPRRMLYEGQL